MTSPSSLVPSPSSLVPILSCRNVSIRYQIGDFKNIGFKEWVMRRLTGRYEVVDFWADRNVDFEIYKGDMLGIIGANGAGKSTLLKAVSGIMEPTQGRIERKGRVSALLELASGFDGDLTVKENAYLRGAMLGYTRAFMDETYKYIIDFSELKDFEDRPFKQLSSGMKSRLAFAIASLVKPEILILDEVLSVGDGAFRQKSEAKMREIIRGGATTILVSHSIAQIRSLCNKILWLHKGEQIAFTDDVQGVCDSYEEFLRAPAGTRPRFDPEEIAAKRAAAKAEAERQAEERRRQEEERRRKAAEAAAELARLRAEAAKLAHERYHRHHRHPAHEDVGKRRENAKPSRRHHLEDDSGDGRAPLDTKYRPGKARIGRPQRHQAERGVTSRDEDIDGHVVKHLKHALGRRMRYGMVGRGNGIEENGARAEYGGAHDLPWQCNT